VYLPDELKSREQTASIIGFVLKTGSEAYKDEDKFPSGPYCKEGDFVIFRSYSGDSVQDCRQRVPDHQRRHCRGSGRRSARI